LLEVSRIAPLENKTSLKGITYKKYDFFEEKKGFGEKPV
jgi:hypothetical protein